MKKEDLFIDEFLKQLNSSDELNDFLNQLKKCGIEKMLKTEPDRHLGHDKNQNSDNANTPTVLVRKSCVPPLGNHRSRFPEIVMHLLIP